MNLQATTVARYLAKRLIEFGVSDYFAIPGDYNLILLDELLKEKNLRAIYCCNELNAGYAADGYARQRGIAAAFVTYSVGGLSIINAAAGAYAEDLPIVFVSGAPNTNAKAQNRLLHHTLGNIDYDYVREMFSKVTVASVIIDHYDNAGEKIDKALAEALYWRKPVYLEIPSNVAGLEISMPIGKLGQLCPSTTKDALNAAVEHAATVLNQAVKPVLVTGPKLRTFNAQAEFNQLAKMSGYAYATQPQAKGLVDESDPQYIGVYWGPVSAPGCGEIVESADICLYVGGVFTDYSTAGYTALLREKHLILVEPHSVKIQGNIYNQVNMADFLAELATKLNMNSAALNAYRRIQGEAPPIARPDDKAHIPTRYLFEKIQTLLDEKTTLIAETGDSWFNAMRLKLPSNCHLEIQMQYGSIGWSVGAMLGYQVAVEKSNRRVIALIGDGSFQMSAQEVSTLLRYNLKPIIFLLNNQGYTIEVEIHDGPYNYVNNWNYAKLIEAFDNRQYNPLIQQVKNVSELDQAIHEAKNFAGLCFIEVYLDRDDCNKNLLKWGSYVAKVNAEKPQCF